MQSKAKTPEEYIAELPKERQEAIIKLRAVINKNISKKFKEIMCYGMIGYVIPHSIYPNGYHCNPKQPLPFINIASQKNYISIYHMGIYGSPKLLEWFLEEHKKASPKKLDLGKGCMRYKNINDIPYKLIGELVSKISAEDWIEMYEKLLQKNKK